MQLGGVPIFPPVHGARRGRMHLPLSNRVPLGQQLGNVPTGRSPEQTLVCVLPLVPPLPLSPVPVPLRRQTPFSKRVPLGQQLGGVPMGRAPEQTLVCVLLVPGVPLLPPPEGFCCCPG